MRAFIKYALLLGSLLSAALLALCRVIPNINPYEQSMIAILGLLTPVLAFINIVFVTVWLLSRKYFFVLIPLSGIAISWNVFSVNFACNYFSKQDFSKSEKNFSMLSYNVRLLNLYKGNKDTSTRTHMLDLLAEKNPTVLCLQEFYTGNDSTGINNILSINERCHYEYVATCDVNVNRRGKWGSIIFSHVPIIHTENHDIDVFGSNLLQQADIKVGNDTLSIFNIHLKSNRLSEDETGILSNSEMPELDQKTQKRTISIFNKLEKSSINRGLEADLVSNIIHRNTHKKIVCGDLNDIPSSYVYFRMRQKMKDVFLEKGAGLGATYISAIPLLRIDYIFHSKEIELLGFKKLKVRYSDHYPIWVNFTI